MMQDDLLKSVELVWVQGDPDDILLNKLHRIVNKYRHLILQKSDEDETEKLSLQVRDLEGEILGGVILQIHQDWLEISLMALEKGARGCGVGRQMMIMIEEKAHELNRKKIRIETCEINLGFFGKLGYKIGGKLEDLPPGIIYFWLSKNLD
ncbi:MAG: GNAT family N-acetyltransferase [Brevefilum sp.]|nr:GNAT family N-acetyltransferase [Brevefilum sp.]MDT8381959.1 GNAT family N-acetyltransferase [Brevefilum sp.]